jgi:alanine racemase
MSSVEALRRDSRTAGTVRRPNVFEIDLTAVKENLDEIRRFVGAKVKIFVAMKANAYGLGLLEAASVVQDSEADAIAVADPNDAALLRDHGIKLPILLYACAVLDDSIARLAEERDVIVTPTDLTSARALSKAASRPIKVMPKIDVGLERLGVPVADGLKTVVEIASLPNLKLAGLYTHMHVPRGEDNREYIDWQLARFSALLGELRERQVRIDVAMAASTPVLATIGPGRLNAVDVGRMAYGHTRSDVDDVGPMRIRPTFISLRSQLVQCKTIDRVEYLNAAPYPLRPGMRIGVAPIGYADGIDSLNCGVALVRAHRVPIVASPSLEHTRLDLSDVPDAGAGDEVVFVGPQMGECIGTEEVLQYQGFDQLTQMAVAVRSSVPRIYHRPGK